jgi:hypothetical protein
MDVGTSFMKFANAKAVRPVDRARVLGLGP